MWFSILTAGLFSVEICDNKQTKVVHTNRLRHRYIPDMKDCTTDEVKDTNLRAESCARGNWAPAEIEHIILPIRKYI